MDALTTHGPYIRAHSHNGGYDALTAVVDGRTVSGRWLAVPPSGKAFKLAPGEKIPLMRNVKPFATFDDAAAFIERVYSLEPGWAREKHGRWVPKAGSTDRPCGESTYRSEGLSTTHGTCDLRRKPGEAKCGRHLTVDRKAAERRADEQEKAAQSDAGKSIAADAIEALKARDIVAGLDYEPYRSARSPGGYTGRVTVHAEDVLAMVRRLAHLEEVVGVEAGVPLDL